LSSKQRSAGKKARSL